MLRFLGHAPTLFGLPILGACLLIGSAPRIGAQYYFPRPPVGARALALGSSNLADPRDAHDLNPAIQREPDPSSTAERPLGSATLLGTSFMPAPGGLEHSWSASADGVWTLNPLDAVGVALSRFQYEDIYSSQQIGLLYARTIPIVGDGIAADRQATVGARLQYTTVNFGEHYLPLTELAADVGVEFDLTQHLRAGAAVTHLASLMSNQNVEAQSRTGYLGLSYRPLDELAIHGTVESSQGQPVSCLAGIEYRLDPHVVIRAGTETAVGLLSGGIGLRYGSMQLDFAAEQHPDLGSSVCMGIIYAL